ncbi:hypothetical protein MTR_1g041675 [Medicago truncatula]|uniref:DUF7745 domain-containing protein n=1 Tax=Medicago truncatula TaxID=3880 RepID=A0A072VGC7_MEDTR|nr:hypothetical protein MTR_1g041675 [Medicago truncatula]
MGIQGCINYNPVLALRQLDYSIKEEPTPKLTTPFTLYDMSADNFERLMIF